MKWLNNTLLLCLFSAQTLAFEHFISRKGAQLFDGEHEFRFAGLHAPELHRIENDAKGVCAADPRGWGQYFQWPTADEQENWIKALTRSGHKAMRIYVLSVAQESDEACGRETHILAPLTKGGMPRLNETAMVVYDRMIMLADKHGLRLILPFIDHWQWWGGREQLAAFYDENQEAFYDINSKTYQAYQSIIKQVISRKNTLTGRYYYDEKALMAWETGNELKDTNQAFLENTVALIDQLAPQQLVVDGNYLELKEYSITNPHVDIISNHFYTTNNNNKPETIQQDLQQIAGRKAYLVGEFGLTDASILNNIMQTAVHHEYQGAQAVGAFIWGFRGHRHNGGFYFHKEYTGHYSYHLPGFVDAEENQELAVVDLVRLAQAQMRGLTKAPALPVPEAPVLRPINSLYNIQWLGAPLGQSYRIERSIKAEGPWQVIGDNISDGKQAFDPAKDSLFADKSSLQTGQSYYYRVIALNVSGESAPSNIQSFKFE
ncbi:glycoside hydrolase 5 family protein [Paraglaciecola hydrolytica]|uniref:mannan endo-1,4-beta-mannosidase n=1 Tax=Paraglaciecola hydrolytica TaxID=1799789 RepID=A0A148KN87_9ALTE|nr:beta-mannanase man5E [Paraglaciecola hydrolytica]KXI27786.1 beta-mannanase man5E [Paraglaciecola hydrolytica]